VVVLSWPSEIPGRRRPFYTDQRAIEDSKRKNIEAVFETAGNLGKNNP
jgi:hypothetical protein